MTELTPEQRALLEDERDDQHPLMEKSEAIAASLATIDSQAAALAELTQQIDGVQGALADAGDVFCSREDGDYGASVRQVVEQRDASRAALAERDAEIERLRRLLQRTYQRTGIIDNGYCVFCGRTRLWTAAGANYPPTSCENPDCVTHEIEAELSQARGGG